MDKKNGRDTLIQSVKTYIRFAQLSGIDTLPKKRRAGRTTIPSLPGKNPPSLFVRNPPEGDLPESLQAVRDALGECTRCKLHATRTTIVFGTGNPRAQLVFVGEGPGEEEDRQGKPFVGRAGQLLTKIIQAMGLSREEVYITNIIKCRPPKNRNPQPDEIAACEPFLIQQLRFIRPKVICALGTFAAQTLLSTTEKITQLRGRFHEYHGIPIMPTFHPAYLLRNPQEKRRVWEDMQRILERLGRKPPA